MPKTRKNPSRKVVKKRLVNKKGFTYINKYGKKVHVGSYYRKDKIFPNPHFSYRTINGENRLCKITRKGNKEYIQVVEDKRKIQRIKQSTKMKNWSYNYYPTKTMEKELPHNIMEGIKEIGKDDYEHSIAIDFEREIYQPQRMAVVEGGKTQTIRIDDFEIYGHTHPGEDTPRPSIADLITMEYLEPDFIVAGKSGKIHIYNIENPGQYLKWKIQHPYEKGSNPIHFGDIYKVLSDDKYRNKPGIGELTPYNYEQTKLGREMFFDITGVKIYPYKKGTIIEMKDDPHFEKRMPTVQPKYQEKYYSQRMGKEMEKVKLTKDEIRLRMLELTYYNLFYDTKMFADSFNISTSEAYKHAKWLEDKGLLYGEAQSGTGISTERGTHRVKSILWEPVYAEEREDKWEDVKKEYIKVSK